MDKKLIDKRIIAIIAILAAAFVLLLLMRPAPPSSLPASNTLRPSPGSSGEICLDITRSQAEAAAAASECAQGKLKETGVCNEGTRTWWIDLDLEKEGCNPACVIHIAKPLSAEINWRCTGLLPSGPQNRLDDSEATDMGVGELVAGNNEFALDFYNKITEEDQGNIFFSPWSLESALSMTMEGARGQTFDEMLSVLHLPKDLAVRGPAFARLMNELNAPGKPYQLSTANALWPEKTYPFLDDYFALVGKYYGGKLENLDYRNDVEGSRRIINTWVESRTMGKIKDLIPIGILTPMTRLVLTNAIYFKGSWATQFNKTLTREADFKVMPSKIVKVPMMYQSADFKYLDEANLQLLEMPYKGNNLSMVILLPKTRIADLEASLTIDKLEAWRRSAYETKVKVYIPKFESKTKYFLKDVLSDMGMPTAFDVADFSGMDGTRNLRISEVIHQAYVSVDEEGTEATAATAVIIMKVAIMEPTVFRADRPFIYLIMKGDTILFMGRVMDPTEL